MSDPDTIEQYGRGKMLEIVPCMITDQLRGTVGKIEDKEFVHVSGIVVSSESPKLPKGLLVEFVLYSFETERVREYAQEAEIAMDLGIDMAPQIMKLKFDRAIKVANGSIRPPSISFRSPTAEELPLARAASKLYDMYPATIVDPVVGFPGLNQGCGTVPVLKNLKTIGQESDQQQLSGGLGLMIEASVVPDKKSK